MARRSDHTREELRELVINTSIDIIETEGLQALTARKIASVIGYSPGTIYNLFPSMDALCLIINGMTIDALNDALNDPACNKQTASPADNMKAMARQYLDFAARHKERWMMLFSYKLPDGKDVPVWFQEKVAALFAPLERILTPLYGADTKNCKLAARTLWASVHGICFVEQTGKMPIVIGSSSGEAMTSTLIDNFVAGIQG